jgi:predicted transcriptional regulator
VRNAYSPIDRLASELTRPKGTGAEFMTELSKKPGYKQAEVEDRDLQTLTALPKMAREDFLKALRAKRVTKPDEVVLGERKPFSLKAVNKQVNQYIRQTASTQAENAESSSEARAIRNETMRRMRASRPEHFESFRREVEQKSGFKAGPTHHEEWTLPGGSNYREILLKHPNPQNGGFEGLGGHFGDEPDILASIRVKDRTGPNGEKILHLEEIQSDWHQTGREKGYLPKNHQELIDAAYGRAQQAKFAHIRVKNDLQESKSWSNTLSDRLGAIDPENSSVTTPRRAEYESQLRFHNNKIMELMPQVMKADQARHEAEADYQRMFSQSGVPDAPYKKNWHELALKRMIQHAAEKGYDSIAITPGEEQAKRYSLAKHIDRIELYPNEFPNKDTHPYYYVAYDKNQRRVVDDTVTPEKLESHIGKELANKLLSTEPDKKGERYLDNANLDVGGEGMKGFYDKMVPKFLNQFGKKYGAQVGQVQIPGDPNGRSDTAMKLGVSPQDYAAMSREEKDVFHAKLDDINAKRLHSFPITPEMREDVTKNGIPLYKSGGEVEVRPTTKDETIQRKIPEMEAAAKALQAGAIDRKEYDRVVKKHKPVKPYDFVPQPASDEDADRALMENKKPQWRGHSKWPAGRKVGLRLDIPAYEQHGVWVNSIHDEEGREGDKLKTSYAPVSSVKNATFDAGPEKAIKVATGEQNKSPFARIKGELHHMTEDEAVEHMKEHLNNPDYAQVGMDPRRHGFFYDRKTLKPVTHSAHVVQIGPLVLAHKPTYGKRETYADGGSVMGINVASDRKSDRKYADMIVDGHKTFESRNSDTLRPYVGKRVAIVRTGEGKAKAIGEVTIGEPTVVNKQKFRALEDKHHVPEGSAFDIGGNTKHLYPLSDPVRYEQERDVGHGIVARKVLAHGGMVSRETIKPISRGIIKERVTVSPDKDVMMYELMSAKHFTKKVK